MIQNEIYAKIHKNPQKSTKIHKNPQKSTVIKVQISYLIFLYSIALSFTNID